MTNAEARCNKSLRPRKPEGSLGRTAQDVHLDSHTAPELWRSPEAAVCILTVGFLRRFSWQRSVVHFDPVCWLHALEWNTTQSFTLPAGTKPIDRLEDRGVGKGSAWRSCLKGREKATISKATLGNFLRDRVERIWAFPPLHRYHLELNWTLIQPRIILLPTEPQNVLPRTRSGAWKVLTHICPRNIQCPASW